jgi:hypothetical protein
VYLRSASHHSRRRRNRLRSVTRSLNVPPATCDFEPFAAASRPFAVPCRSLPGPRDHTVPAAVAPATDRLSLRRTYGARFGTVVAEQRCCYCCCFETTVTSEQKAGNCASCSRHGHQLAIVAVRLARANASAAAAQPCVALYAGSEFAGQARCPPADALEDSVRPEPADHIVAASPPRTPEDSLASVRPSCQRCQSSPQCHKYPTAAGVAARCAHDSAISSVPTDVDTRHGRFGRPCKHATTTAGCTTEFPRPPTPSYVSATPVISPARHLWDGFVEHSGCVARPKVPWRSISQRWRCLVCCHAAITGSSLPGSSSLGATWRSTTANMFAGYNTSGSTFQANP